MRRFILLSVLACLALTTHLHAAEPAKAPEDKRLQKKVTIKAMGVPLGDFLKDLSTKTGVKMTARKDVADDKLAVFVKSMSLADLQTSIKDALHVRCTANAGADKAVGYEFWMDAKTEQGIAKYEQEYLTNLRKQITDLSRDLDLSEDEIAKKYKDGTSGRYQLQDPVNRNHLRVYAGLSSNQCDALWNDNAAIVIPMSQLPRETRDALLAGLNERERRRRESTVREYARSGNDVPAEDTYGLATWERIDSVGFHVEPTPMGSSPTLACTIYGLGHDPPSATGTETTISGTSSFMGLDVQGDEPGTDDEQKKAIEAAKPKTAEEYDAVLDKLYPGEKIKMDKNDKLKFYDRLGEIAKKSDLSIISPYYTCKIAEFTFVSFDEVKGTKADIVLRRLMPDEYTKVEKRENLRLIVMSDWPSCRNREIPERMLVGWRDTMEKQGYLGLKELLETGQLRREQFDDLYRYGIGQEYGLDRIYDLLVWMHGLDPGQMSKLMTNEGITAQELTVAQTMQFLKWMGSRHSSVVSANSTNDTAVDGSATNVEPSFSAISLEEHKRLTGDGKEIPSFRLHTKVSDAEEITHLSFQDRGRYVKSRAPQCEITVQSQ